MDITCIKCPVGCALHITKKNNQIIVTGNSCPRGKEYGTQEMLSPVRMLTTVKAIPNGTITLRTSRDVPKAKYMDILRAVQTAKTKSRYKVGEIFLSNVCNTDADLIITSINQKVL